VVVDSQNIQDEIERVERLVAMLNDSLSHDILKLYLTDLLTKRHHIRMDDPLRWANI